MTQSLKFLADEAKWHGVILGNGEKKLVAEAADEEAKKGNSYQEYILAYLRGRAGVWSFESALTHIKKGRLARRIGWGGRPKVVSLQPAENGMSSYLKIAYVLDGVQAPWTPTRCDLLEEDWVLL